MVTMAQICKQEITELILDAYWKVLEPYTDEQCEKAFNVILETAKFWPKPSDILEAIKGKHEDRALKVYQHAYETACKVGAYRSVQFADAKIHSVIKLMGGWSKFCHVQESERVWQQKEFERIYNGLSNAMDHPEHLEGIHEREALKKGIGQKFDPPVDVDKLLKPPAPQLPERGKKK